jgi:prepilin-type processing-associated H-X9-DG protein
MRVALLSLLLIVVLAVPAEAATFGPDLGGATPNFPSCGAYGWSQGCTLIDPLADDMELVLPDPVAHGNQTGVVTAIHVKSAATAPAQFVVVEWSGKPGEGQPFPSGVMAVSAPVTLQPGINNFNTNLPVDFRLGSDGFETWSQVSLTILNGTSPVPAQYSGGFAEMGTLSDGWAPLTQTVADLTAVPHNPQVGGLPPARLLMSGEVTITTGQGGNPGGNTGPGDDGTPTPATSTLTVPASVRLKGRTAPLTLQCVGAADCSGTLRIQSRPATSKKPLTYASGAFSIGAGLKSAVKAKLSSAGRKALRRHRSVRAYANVTFADGRVTSAKIALRR